MPEQPVYLDHAATTPIRECALAAWLDVTRTLADRPGNPNAVHAGGRGAKRMLEDARERLASALGADRAEVIFTSGATESAALGIIGAALGGRDSSIVTDEGVSGRIVVSGIEHPAVAEGGERAEAAGIEWKVLPTTRDGRALLEPGSLGPATTLASLAMVCSETGVIQPVPDLVRLGKQKKFLVHSDATQAVGNLALDFQGLGLDLMTIGGHKFGAPVGTGALLVKRGVKIVTDRPGGGQERTIRSGTQDVAGAVALAVAAEEAVSQIEERSVKHLALREQLAKNLPENVRMTELAESVPSIVHLSMSTRHPEAVLLELDRAGILASAGSACHAGVTRPSQVLLSMGRSEDEALGVLRVSFGRDSSSHDVDALIRALPGAVAAAQKLDALEAEGRVR
ncbi:cysteine desulfurase family protein [Actinomycetaceae bacterium MB13-C1-2]|nr:cysteine desulfurase family protein [Actinomycetaceae bacterium MB13-C1-2]